LVSLFLTDFVSETDPVIIGKEGYIKNGLLTVNFVVYFEAFLSDVFTVGVMKRET
jgi:hypothetical protein